jgi:Protein of unknown function (DUF3800)
MAALGLHRLVPRSLLAGRWIAVLVCYLDDSGQDPQNPITTLAGYIARDTAWEAFETDVEKWFTEFKVNILRAKHLHDTDEDFEGWGILRKQAFVSRICQVRNPHVMMGLSMSALKGQYELRAEERDAKRTVTPYSFCFEVIIDWILRDVRIGRAANTEGVALILECGHKNNPEAEQEFYAVRKLHKIEHLLHSISFVPKENCRAIQLADLIAFYSRRDGNAQYLAKKAGRETYESEMMIKIITENCPHRGFVATDFGPHSGSPFLVGGQLS